MNTSAPGGGLRRSSAGHSSPLRKTRSPQRVSALTMRGPGSGRESGGRACGKSGAAGRPSGAAQGFREALLGSLFRPPRRPRACLDACTADDPPSLAPPQLSCPQWAPLRAGQLHPRRGTSRVSASGSPWPGLLRPPPAPAATGFVLSRAVGPEASQVWGCVGHRHWPGAVPGPTQARGPCSCEHRQGRAAPLPPSPAQPRGLGCRGVLGLPRGAGDKSPVWGS